MWQPPELVIVYVCGVSHNPVHQDSSSCWGTQVFPGCTFFLCGPVGEKGRQGSEWQGSGRSVQDKLSPCEPWSEMNMVNSLLSQHEG